MTSTNPPVGPALNLRRSRERGRGRHFRRAMETVRKVIDDVWQYENSFKGQVVVRTDMFSFSEKSNQFFYTETGRERRMVGTDRHAAEMCASFGRNGLTGSKITPKCQCSRAVSISASFSTFPTSSRCGLMPCQSPY